MKDPAPAVTGASVDPASELCAVRAPPEQPVVRREEESEERPLPMQPEPEEEGFLQQLQVAFTAPELPQAIYQPYKTKATALMRDFIMGFKTGTPSTPTPPS